MALVHACGLPDARRAASEARRLLELGADVDEHSMDGLSALHAASARGHVRLALLLLQRGAAVDARDFGGRTPLHVAARLGCIPLVQALLGSRADARLPDAAGGVAAELARAEGHATLARVLEHAARTDLASGGEVVLHVYGLGTHPTLARLDVLCRLFGSGLYHTAIEVRYLSCGLEWSFGHTVEGTGVFAVVAGENRDHRYSYEVALGRVELSQVEFAALLEKLKEEWLGSTYDLVSNNCQVFCDALCSKLAVQPLPRRVKRMAGVARFATYLSTRLVHPGERTSHPLEQSATTRGARWETRQQRRRTLLRTGRRRTVLLSRTTAAAPLDTPRAENSKRGSTVPGAALRHGSVVTPSAQAPEEHEPGGGNISRIVPSHEEDVVHGTHPVGLC
ncbi:hypothetical protein AB1Y20_010661 [Prymnesium parvum]|uniref:PPPDE domain-containing protein n=1 Tax=Prymnesium parvum TaxID=97485 RepID=A0AB34IPY0_PRYPA